MVRGRRRSRRDRSRGRVAGPAGHPPARAAPPCPFHGHRARSKLLCPAPNTTQRCAAGDGISDRQQGGRVPWSRRTAGSSRGAGGSPGGAKAETLGVCPAASEARASGLNGGRSGGRACWAIAGTLCGGKVQGTFAEKFSNCLECDFYMSVRDEEGADFKPAAAILEKLK
ncbi:MAG: two-CW domain-containing protein [Planctomycetota bacterium]